MGCSVGGEPLPLRSTGTSDLALPPLPLWQFPTIMLRHPTGQEETYEGPLDADALQHWVEAVLHSPLQEWDGESLERNVLSGTGRATLVMFSLPQCGPCNILRGQVRDLAAQQKGVVMAVVNCETTRHICHQLRVPFFPYLVLFPSDSRSLEDGMVLTQPPRRMTSPAEEVLQVTGRVLRALFPSSGNEADGAREEL